MNIKKQYELACRYWRAKEAAERYWYENEIWNREGESSPVTDYYDDLEETHAEARNAYIRNNVPGDLVIKARVSIALERAKWFYLGEQAKRARELEAEYLEAED
ncbi:MAG: hypothetical protein WC455_19090 [Dehalococcoidia bacterium]|jgi:hypothetical protein